MVHLSRICLLLIMLALGWLGWMYAANRTVCEKILTELAMPAGLIWIGSAGMLIVAGFHRQRLLFVLSALIWLTLFLAGNSYLAILLVETLERPYLTTQPLEQAPMDAIVLLGGATAVSNNGMARLGWAGDRVMLAVRLYRRGLTERLICTGSRIADLDRDGKDPKDVAAELCVDAGVPAARVEVVEGINTNEEMKNLASLLDGVDRVGLVTSAFHMSRALRLARREGLEFIPLPAHMLTPPIVTPNLLDLVPDAEAMVITRVACKEYLARLVGR